MKVVIPAVLEKARELGVSVDQIIHKVIFMATLIIFLILFFIFRRIVHPVSSGTQGWFLPTGSWQLSTASPSLTLLNSQCTTR
jgi:hypothetical protein